MLHVFNRLMEFGASKQRRFLVSDRQEVKKLIIEPARDDGD